MESKTDNDVKNSPVTSAQSTSTTPAVPTSPSTSSITDDVLEAEYKALKDNVVAARAAVAACDFPGDPVSVLHCWTLKINDVRRPALLIAPTNQIRNPSIYVAYFVPQLDQSFLNMFVCRGQRLRELDTNHEATCTARMIEYSRLFNTPNGEAKMWIRAARDVMDDFTKTNALEEAEAAAEAVAAVAVANA